MDSKLVVSPLCQDICPSAETNNNNTTTCEKSHIHELSHSLMLFCILTSAAGLLNYRLGGGVEVNILIIFSSCEEDFNRRHTMAAFHQWVR